MTLIDDSRGKPCRYCGEPMIKPSREHTFPKSLGGQLIVGRRGRIVCDRCNFDKGNLTLVQWLAVLVAARDGRAFRVCQQITSLLHRGMYGDCSTEAANELRAVFRAQNERLAADRRAAINGSAGGERRKAARRYPR